MTDFICISDLRWHTFYHACPLPWRFVRKPRVLFVEPPLISLGAGCAKLEVLPQSTTLTVVRLRVPALTARKLEHGNSTLQPLYNDLLGKYLEENNYQRPLLWLNTPAGAGFADVIPCQLMVYDAARIQPAKTSVNIERLNPEAILVTGSRR
ncbi:MAG: hypothetical protein IPO91_26600 [Chloroflexi bacterium]|nr:hypothetical protein [Chloroflexota bacterium]